MKVLLILAGKSRRFWPLSEKPLFPICGKSLVEHQVDRLREGGCDDIILVVSPENKEVIARIYPSLPIVVQKGNALGMHRACLDALPQCGSAPVLIVSGNDVIDPSAYAMLKKEAAQKGVDGAILARKVENYFPGGYLTLRQAQGKPSGRIASIVEKPGPGKEPSNLVNIVAHLHNDASVLLAALTSLKSESDDGYERALDSLLHTHHYRAVPYEGMWQAVKYPWHLLHLLPALLQEIKKPSIHKTASIHTSAVVEGNVIIEENVRILPNASAIGPCYIGAGSVIGNNALVRGSSIGRACVVGFGSEVKGSVLAGPVWTHMTYLGDSIVGRNVSFGGGTITGNLRLDEGEILSIVHDEAVPTGLTKLGAIVGDDCRLGIHIGTNPGIKIGGGSFVTGGVFIHEDIPGTSFVRMKEGEMEVRQNRTQPPAIEERKKYFR